MNNRDPQFIIDARKHANEMNADRTLAFVICEIHHSGQISFTYQGAMANIALCGAVIDRIVQTGLEQFNFKTQQNQQPGLTAVKTEKDPEK